MNLKRNISQPTAKSVLYNALIQSNSQFTTFQQLPMVKDMPQEHAMMLFSSMKEECFYENDIIYTADTETTGKMYLILDGYVNVADMSGHHYGRLGTGCVFGLFSFLDDKRAHSATIQAETGVTVLTLERSYFDLINLEDPKLAQHLMRFMFGLLSEKALKMETEYAHIHQYALGRKV
ncbi:MAG: cyclic nucleotide-binding domain-containing protein [Mariprofundaceae bacterium]|nr:cyclic nucleotide-binding domain-containing protein [Mariprofundaceae bacterium]